MYYFACIQGWHRTWRIYYTRRSLRSRSVMHAAAIHRPHLARQLRWINLADCIIEYMSKWSDGSAIEAAVLKFMLWSMWWIMCNEEPRSTFNRWDCRMAGRCHGMLPCMREWINSPQLCIGEASMLTGPSCTVLNGSIDTSFNTTYNPSIILRCMSVCLPWLPVIL